MKRKLGGLIAGLFFMFSGLLVQAAQVEMPFANITPEVAPETMREQATENGQAPEQGKMIVLADINFRNPLLLRQEKNQLELFFHLENKLPQGEAGIRYGVQLVKNKTILDETVYTDDTLSVAGNSSTQKIFSYTAPAHLSGDFELWLVAKNENGMPLALFKFETPLTLAGSNQYLGIDSRSCNLTVDGDKEAKDYALLQGVSLKQEETLKLKCAVVSYFPSAVTVTPIFNTFERSLYGNLIDKDNQAEITFQPGETKLIELPVKKPTNPQAYEVRLDFLQIMTATSNPIIFHYVIAGESATIQKLDLDKVSYKKGETINATLIWSGAADNFPGSRTGKTENEKVFLSLDIFDQAKQKCADTLEKTLEPNSQEAKLALKTRANCPDPKVTVTLKNEAGTVLAQKEFDFKKETGENILQKQKMAQGRAILVWLIVLILVGLLVVFLMKRKTKTIFTKILPLIILVLFGMSFGKAEALTLGYSSSWSSNSISIGFNGGKTVYNPGESITVNGSGSYWEACNNVTNWMTLSSSCGGTLIYASGTGGISGSGSCSASSSPGSHSINFTNELFGECYRGSEIKETTSINECGAAGQDICQDRYCFVWEAESRCYYDNGSICYPNEATACDRCEIVYSIQRGGRNYASASGSLPYTVPAAPVPTATCNASFSPTSITAPASSTLTWSSSNATSMVFVCSGPLPGGPAAIAPSGSAPLSFTATQTGTETCVFTPYNSAGTAGIPCSASVTIGGSYSCTGSIPAGSTMCSGDNTGLTETLPWAYAGTTSASCTARKCQYYTPQDISCTGSIPAGSTMCPGDDIGLTATLPWAYTGTTLASCTVARKCQYYTPPISAATCTTSWSPTSITAPGSSNLTWSSTNAGSMTFVCSGPISSGPAATTPSGGPMAVPFTAAQTGIETCTFTPYNSAGTAGVPCSASVTISGTLPPGGCDAHCRQNSDCESHLSCVWVGARQRCRLASNPTSTTCSSDPGTCGNGIIDPGEQCDPASFLIGDCGRDDCSSSCICNSADKRGKCGNDYIIESQANCRNTAPTNPGLCATGVDNGVTYVPTSFYGPKWEWQCWSDIIANCLVYKCASATPTCGPADRDDYPATATKTSGALCNPGTANKIAPVDFENNNKAIWKCTGTDGVSRDCEANRACSVLRDCQPDCNPGDCSFKTKRCIPLPGGCADSCNGYTCSTKSDCGPCNSGEWIEVPGN